MLNMPQIILRDVTYILVLAYKLKFILYLLILNIALKLFSKINEEIYLYKYLL